MYDPLIRLEGNFTFILSQRPQLLMDTNEDVLNECHEAVFDCSLADIPTCLILCLQYINVKFKNQTDLFWS